MHKILLIFISCAFALSCSSEAKIVATPPAEKGSEKLTPADNSNEQLRIGIQVLLSKISESAEAKIVKGFEDKLSVFTPCLKETGKGEVVRLRASFKLTKSGSLSAIEILEVVPESEPFKACFLKQIKHLSLGRQTRAVRGELGLGTYYGAK